MTLQIRMNQILQMYGSTRLGLRGIIQLENTHAKLTARLENLQKRIPQPKIYSDYEVYLLRSPKALEEHVKALKYANDTNAELHNFQILEQGFWKWMVSSFSSFKGNCCKGSH